MRAGELTTPRAPLLWWTERIPARLHNLYLAWACDGTTPSDHAFPTGPPPCMVSADCHPQRPPTASQHSRVAASGVERTDIRNLASFVPDLWLCGHADASIWVNQFIKAMRNQEGEMVRNAHLQGFFRRICR